MIRILEFQTRYKPTSEGMKGTDWVLLAPIGADHNKTQTWRRVAKIRPPETDDPNILDSMSYQDMAAKWSIIGPAYDAWKNGQEIPDDGTPLEAWAAVSPEQAKHMKAMGIRTVENIRDLDDASVSKLPFPNARKMPALAKRFLESEGVAAKDAEIEELRAKLEAAIEMIEAKAEPQDDDKPKRGRPRKTEAEAA